MTNLFHHIAHMKDKPNLSAGQIINRFDLIGYVGKTGTKYAHCHYEVAKSKPPTWNFYPIGLTKQQVASLYLDPIEFMVDGLPCLNTSPDAGYGFLDWTGEVYHPARDLNSGIGDQDLGNPIQSPIYGRVVYIGYTVNHLTKLGWGWHIWIEQLNERKFMNFQAIKFDDDSTIFLLSGNSLFPFAGEAAYLHAGGIFGKEIVVPASQKGKYDIRFESPIIKATK